MNRLRSDVHPGLHLPGMWQPRGDFTLIHSVVCDTSPAITMETLVGLIQSTQFILYLTIISYLQTHTRVDSMIDDIHFKNVHVQSSND